MPAGTEDTPLELAIIPSGRAQAGGAVEVIETAIKDKSGVVVQISLVQQPYQALSALCQSPSGPPTAAWLDGLAAAAATAQGCGDAELIAEQVTGSSLQAAAIIVPAASDINDAAALQSRSYCRVSANDLTSWLLPSILMQARDISPVRDLGDIRDYEDADALLAAVASGDCESAGIDADALRNADPELRRQISIIGSLEVPYQVLVYPQQVNLSQRGWLNEALIAIAADEELAPALQALIGQAALRDSEPGDFEPLTSALRAAGLDLARFGDL
jgi:ABC-type phosphate/phosphonate transport system substrate-binding protein